MKKLLLATDFSKSALAAEEHTILLAKALDGEIVVLHAWNLPVLPFQEGAINASPDQIATISATAQKALDGAVARIQARFPRTTGLLRVDEPWQAIVECAKEISADMIVVGTHGRRGLPRLLLGSVAERVVRTAGCPVLTVHSNDSTEA